MRQCIATTKKGKRCANTGKPDRMDLCTRHFKQFYPSPKSSLDKVGRVIKMGGGVIGTVSGILKIVEYVTAHWDKIEHIVSYLARGAGVYWWINLRLIRAKGINENARRIIEEGQYSKEDAEELFLEFSNWFKDLPDDIKDKVRECFGEKIVDEFIEELNTTSKEPNNSFNRTRN